MKRLFLGGPAHGRRIDIEEDSTACTAPVVRPALIWSPEDDGPSEVIYRSHRVPGTTERVFVAPDYTFDTPEWLAFDTEAWLRRWPDVTGWEHLGPWFWRGRLPETGPFDGWWLYVLGEKSGTGFISQQLDDRMITRIMIDDFNTFIHDEMQREIDYQMLPACVVPDCEKKGTVTYRAEERGKLAGQAWRTGDEIRLCPEHSYDLRLAEGVFGLDQLADWLKPDARVSQEEHFILDEFVDDSSRNTAHDRWARILRISQKIGPDE